MTVALNQMVLLTYWKKESILYSSKCKQDAANDSIGKWHTTSIFM